MDSIQFNNNNNNNKYPNDSLQFIYKHFHSSVHIRLINALIKSGVCDIIEKCDTPKSYQELAIMTKCSEEGMHKMLRYFSFYNIVFENRVDCNLYSKTHYTYLFTKNSMFYDMIDMFSSDMYYDIFKCLPDSFLNGKSAVPKSMGLNDSIWELFNSNDNFNRFKNSMYCITQSFINEIMEKVDFSNSNRVVDVGGSHGELISNIVDKYQHIQGINFDLEKIISNNPKSTNPRLQHVSGSFFDHVPTADTYILKLVLHDWSDEECVKILKCILHNMRPGGRVYIFDYILDPKKYDLTILWYDIKMFHYFNGKERTIFEFTNIIEAAGFKIDKLLNKDLSSGGIIISKR